MNNLMIYKKQTIINKQILHQRFLINESAPWFVINNNNLVTIYQNWIKINNSLEVLIYYSLIFKKENNNFFINEHFFITDENLLSWLDKHNNWIQINNGHKICLKHLPYHIGWEKQEGDIFYYSDLDNENNKISEDKVFSQVYKSVTDKNYNILNENNNFIFIGTPVRNYLYKGITSDKKYIWYQYDPYLEIKKGKKYSFFFTTIKNPLYIGTGLIQNRTNQLDIISCYKIYDCDFKIDNYNNNIYTPFYTQDFSRLDKFYWKKQQHFYPMFLNIYTSIHNNFDSEEEINTQCINYKLINNNHPITDIYIRVY